MDYESLRNVKSSLGTAVEPPYGYAQTSVPQTPELPLREQAQNLVSDTDATMRLVALLSEKIFGSVPECGKPLESNPVSMSDSIRVARNNLREANQDLDRLISRF